MAPPKKPLVALSRWQLKRRLKKKSCTKTKNDYESVENYTQTVDCEDNYSNDQNNCPIEFDNMIL